MPGVGSTIRRFDAYSKTVEEFRVRTVTGAMISVIAVVICGLLFVSELYYYLRAEQQPSLYVDSVINEKMRINFDIEFPHFPCSYLTLDIMDVAGEHQIDIDHDVYKKRLSPLGREINPDKEEKYVRARSDKDLPENYCGSCYGAKPEGECCNTCQAVQEAYRDKGWAFQNADEMEQCVRDGFEARLKAEKNEGCRLHGKLSVNKVAGNFHIAPGKSFQKSSSHIHDLQPFKGQPFNSTHYIHHLSFGEKFPRAANPLNRRVTIDKRMMTMHQYFINVVPTTYRTRAGRKLSTYQYSVTDYSHQVDTMFGRGGLPGVFFRFEISPIRIDYTEEREPLTHFLTSISAIVGGIFTVAGLLDAFVYHSLDSIRGKLDIGKLG